MLFKKEHIELIKKGQYIEEIDEVVQKNMTRRTWKRRKVKMNKYISTRGKWRSGKWDGIIKRRNKT